MKRLFVLLFLIAVNFHVFSQAVDLPPELVWWLNEARMVNRNLRTTDFTMLEQETMRFNASSSSISGHLMAFPIFMSWNYSGSSVAYYDFGFVSLRIQNNGIYKVFSISGESSLVIADKNKHVFFIDSFDSNTRIDGYSWLTDHVLTTVGTKKGAKDYDLYIKTYSINSGFRTVDIATYVCKDALTADDRNKLRMRWVEQRSHFFEFDL